MKEERIYLKIKNIYKSEKTNSKENIHPMGSVDPSAILNKYVCGCVHGVLFIYLLSIYCK